MADSSEKIKYVKPINHRLEKIIKLKKDDENTPDLYLCTTCCRPILPDQIDSHPCTPRKGRFWLYVDSIVRDSNVRTHGNESEK